MPKIDLTFSAGALSDDAKRELPRELAAAMLRWEGAPDTEFFQSIMWVHVHELPAQAVNAAGAPVTEPHFRVDVTVPEGALSERRKEGAVKELTEAVMEAAGLDESAGLRVWVIVREVPEGNWGAGGQVVRFSQLRETAQRERERVAAPAGD